jgi:serine/threonine protein kinase/formylglycine-generating enzyme required for sulfatase activity
MLPEKVPAPENTWSPPEAFDEYRGVRLIGRGGMGEVFVAHDTVLDRPVALKFISAVAPDPRERAQFLTEARAAARLQHPNVLTIHRVGELDARPFIVTEFIRGKTLDRLNKPVPWRRALELGVGLTRGLSAAHRRGVLHRDIKPSNAIIAEDGTVKLLDFGLAKIVEEAPLSQAHSQAHGEEMVSATAPTLAAHAAGDPGDPIKPESKRFSRSGAPRASEVDARTITAVTSPPPTIAALEVAESLRPSGVVETILKGTPYYMAPEIWRGERATRRSDVYSLGALLYELCAGAPPHGGTPLHALPQKVMDCDARPLAEAAPLTDGHFARLIDQCLRRDPTARLASGEELREALEQLSYQPALPEIIDGNPYRGLLPFEAEHRAFFFGRTTEIGTILERLRTEPFVLVAGDSGVGKSSLCRAGVMPLADGALGGARQWAKIRLVPGRDPMGSLIAALAGALGDPDDAAIETLRSDPSALTRALIQRLGSSQGVVIFIDQLEEIVTVAEPSEAVLAGEALRRLIADQPGVRLLATVRSDFIGRVAAILAVGDELTRALYILRPMSPEKIREAIVGPARVKGVSFESDELVDSLVESTARADGGLPLLQFALAEFWDARPQRKKVITAKALALIGGVSGALARHADTIILRMPPEQRAAARRMLLALVTLEGTRARRTEEELAGSDAAANAALKALLRGRLLVARDTAGGVAYEVAHEALLKGWDTLRGWLDEQVGSRAVKQRLEIASAEWERLDRAHEALWSNRQLVEASVLDEPALSSSERSFLSASHGALRRARLIRRALFAAIPIAIAVLYVAVDRKERLDREAAELAVRADIDRRMAELMQQAEGARIRAEAKRKETEAIRREAFLAFNEGNRIEGESLWSKAHDASAEVDREYVNAIQTIETALRLDPSRAPVRDVVVRVLFERAREAEQDLRLSLRDELLRRIDSFRSAGEGSSVDTTAHIEVASDPPGAGVSIQELKEDVQRRYQPGEVLFMGSTPLQRTLPRGSYILSLEAPGRAPIRYPIFLRPEERRSLALELPFADTIPKGFIFIPPGDCFFGTSAESPIRRFLDTVPQHRIATGGYLIAQRETTYAEWIEYLEALPIAERTKRAPRGSEIDLTKRPDGAWGLRLTIGGQTYSARAGEAIVYEGRKLRAEQDWRQFPVAGISIEDALAYAAWLDETGRVRGARLCDEREWERAARGADEREFPHGNRLAPEDANFDPTPGRDSGSFGPYEVGLHQDSQSPFGLDDMAGNVWEPTRSSFVAGAFVLRGGSFSQYDIINQSTNRESINPSVRDRTVGLRLCASPPPKR